MAVVKCLTIFCNQLVCGRLRRQPYLFLFFRQRLFATTRRRASVVFSTASSDNPYATITLAFPGRINQAFTLS